MPRLPVSSRHSILSIATGIVLLGFWVFLVVLSHGIEWKILPPEWQAGFAWEIDNALMPTGTFLAVHALGCLVLFFAFPFVKNGKWKIQAASVIVFSIVLRLVAIWGEPIHESDFYRYIWDGKSFNAGINPYRFEPGAIYLWQEDIVEPFPDENTSVEWRGREFTPDETEILEKLNQLRLEDPEWYSRISHRAVTTVYPPFAQLVFAISALGNTWSVTGLKLLLISFDMGIVLLLLSLARRFEIPVGLVIFYAWNPLVIKEFANSAHYDAVPVFFSVLALWVATGSRGGTVRKAAIVGGVVALGTLSKYFTVLLLPILLIWLGGRGESGRRWGRRLFSREVFAGSFVFALVVIVGFLPFYFWNEAGWENVFLGLGTYGQHWQYNPGFFAIVERSLDRMGIENAFGVARLVSVVLLAIMTAVWALLPMKDGSSVASRCFAVMGTLFLVSPTAFPWYFCWVLAFLIFQPKWSWLILGALLTLNYFDFQPQSDLRLAHLSVGGFWVLSMAIWIVFYLAWIGERTLGKSR